MITTGRYALKRIVLGIISFFPSSIFRFRIRLMGFFYDGKISALISLVLILVDIILGLSPLEIRSSYLSIYFLFMPESSSPVFTRMVLILVNVVCWPRNRSFFIIFSFNVMAGRRDTFCVFGIRGLRNIRLL